MVLLLADRIRVVVDADTVRADDGEIESYLLGLLELDHFSTLRYADDGPPAEALRQGGQLEVTYAPDWPLLDPTAGDGRETIGWATYSDGHGLWKQSRVVGADLLEVPLAFAIQQLGRDANDDQREQIRRDLVAIRVCEAADVAIFVTKRDALLDPPGPVPPAGNCVAMTPAHALIAIGFLLRAKGEYIVHAGRNSVYRINRTWFYAVATQNLLPAGWRWLDAFQQPTATLGGQRCFELCLTLQKRVAGAIKTRDRHASAPTFMNPVDADDEALDCVDAVALNLMGAFDVAARIVDQLMGLHTVPGRIGWHKPAWRRTWSGDLTDLVEAENTHRAVMNVIRMLRNTIHAQAMHIVTIAGDQHRDESYVALPREDTEQLRAAFNDSGGSDQWGVLELYPGHLQANMSLLIDQMIIKGTAALDAIMLTTPVEELLKLHISANSTSLIRGNIDPQARENIRRQVGL